MSRSRQALGVLVVALFGLWGCSRAPSADAGATATAEKLKNVETKLARLEDDFRSAASARDQLAKKLIAAEEARTALQTQVLKLGDEVKSREQQLETRTAERDQAAAQNKVLKDGLKDLLAKVEGESKPDSSGGLPLIPTSNVKPEVPSVPALPVVPAPPK